MILPGSRARVYVPRCTPIPSVCPPDIAASAQSGIGKHAYTFNRQVPCAEHLDFEADCPACTLDPITYTEEDLWEQALRSGSLGCTRTHDTWIVDGDTMEIVAAFRMTIERINLAPSVIDMVCPHCGGIRGPVCTCLGV